MKKFALMLVITLMATITVAAQEKKADAPKADAKPDVALPSVDEVLTKFVKATGGKEALEKLNSRVVKGSFEIEAMGVSGGFQSYAKAPNKNAVIVDVPGFGTVHNVFDGTTAWESNPQAGLRELTGAELAAQKRDHDFYQPLHLKNHYPKMVVKGTEKVGSAVAVVVEATPAEGGPEKFYFDVDSGLLLRQDAERETAQGKMAVEVYFENYKEVDGVKIAHTTKQVTPMFSMTLKLDEIKHNVPVEDSKFNKPAN